MISLSNFNSEQREFNIYLWQHFAMATGEQSFDTFIERFYGLPAHLKAFVHVLIRCECYSF